MLQLRNTGILCKVLATLMALDFCCELYAVEAKLEPSQATVDTERDLHWYDGRTIGIEGKAWNDTATFYNRLPARAEKAVRPSVWSLSQQSAGLCLRFVTDATTIHTRWALTSERLAMPHMPATGVSGVDLYVRTNSKWRWLAVGRPERQTNSLQLVRDLPVGKREYLLYLPLYNGIHSVEVGVPTVASLWQKSLDGEARKPLVFWGTSITQGGCASRPGMVHTAILGRRFGRTVVNLGFSGNGKMEPEVAQLMSEIDAAIYVIDCLPNLNHVEVTQRVEPLVTILRQTRQETPILLVEGRTYADAFLVEGNAQRNKSNRAALREAYQRMQSAGISGLHYLEGNSLLGQDGEDTVDGSHPTDLGFVRQADTFEVALRQILDPTHPPLRWWKGNLHTHTLWSDGNDFPEMVADWYLRHGYNFLALSDHNLLSQGVRWMNIEEVEKRNGQTALKKYIHRFGKHWVETRGEREQGTFEVRLKPLEEVQALVESRGQFLMIQSEEITDRGAHINATNIAEAIQPQGGDSVRETIQNNLRAVAAQSKRLGRTIIPHLNHPNLGDQGISAEELAALIQDEFFEVFNGVSEDGDLGSDRRHGLETLWDITSSLRLSQFHAPPLFGLATDDSHHYHGGATASPGRGWIMLRARRLTPEAIVRALQRGDFYASSGVLLNTVDYDPVQRKLRILIDPDGDAEFTTRFIGTPIDFDTSSSARIDKLTGEPVAGTRDYSQDVGKVLATVQGTEVVYQLTGDELYVRATVTSNQVPANPTTESPFEKAWTQPFGWRSRLAKNSKKVAEERNP